MGPFFHFALPRPGGEELTPPGCEGALRLHGRVLDGAGDPVPDALVEIWQPGPDGEISRQPGSLRHERPQFTGWGRCATDGAGWFRFTTLPPSAASPGGAAFFSVCLLARGLLDRLFTRAYLPDDASALERDRLLTSLSPDRRRTLIARREADGDLRFDLHLQGERETVFLAFGGNAPTGTHDAGDSSAAQDISPRSIRRGPCVEDTA